MRGPMLAIVVGAALAAGCGKTPVPLDPEMLAHRARLLLAEEPSGAQGVLDVRELLADGPREVALVGRIGGLAQTFSNDQATFAIIDPSLVDVDACAAHGDDPCHDENCPFCSRKKEEAAGGVALVHLVDHGGQVLAVPAPRLVDLAEGQTVVVRGRAHIDELGELVVAADGLYIRR